MFCYFIKSFFIDYFFLIFLNRVVHVEYTAKETCQYESTTTKYGQDTSTYYKIVSILKDKFHACCFIKSSLVYLYLMS